MKKAIIAGSNKNFQKLVKNFPNTENHLFLWKPDFSILNSINIELPACLGETIDKNRINKATTELHFILKHWYRDIKGNDLSVFENMSLGLSFESSAELMLYNACLSYLSLKELSVQYDEILIDKSEDNVKTFVCEWLRDNEKLPIKILDIKKIKTDQSYNIHPMLGFRNLNNHFYKGGLLDLFISKLLTFFQSKQNNLIFIMNSGKLNEYFNFKSKANNPLFKLLIPISRNLKYSSNYIFFWKRFYFKNNDGKDLSKILKNIEQNGWNYRSSIIPQKFFKACINNFTIPFWSHAIEYFNSYKALFNYYKPKIALFGTDNSEVPIISAYAASSLGINTMVMPHGIELWGGENLHDTNDGPFKYYAGIGTFDTDNYYSRGISNQRIINANLPWFSHQRFKTSFLKSRIERKKRALLLPLDTGFSMHINANTIHNYILNMISALKECNIEVHGIKFRTIDELEAFGFKNGKNIIRGEEFNVFAGYGDLHNFFNDIDMVVGPISSATVECALANIDYYSFQDFSIYDNNPNIFQSIKNVIEIATKKEELVINIKEQKIYKNGFSVKSLVNTYKDFNESCKKLDDILIEIAVK